MSDNVKVDNIKTDGGGDMEPITAGAMLLASIIGAGASLWQGSQNNAQQQKLHDEEMAMANKQYNWGQTMDRFNMRMTLQEAAAKMDESKRAQLMDALKTHLAVKDRAGNMFSTKR